MAVEIRHKENLSLSQTIKVLEILHEKLGDNHLAPPSLSVLQKASSQFCESFSVNTQQGGVLFFDGKTYLNMYGENKVEVISICYDEQFLALKRVENKQANSVFNAIISVLNEHSLRPKIVVCQPILVDKMTL